MYGVWNNTHLRELGSVKNKEEFIQAREHMISHIGNVHQIRVECKGDLD